MILFCKPFLYSGKDQEFSYSKCLYSNLKMRAYAPPPNYFSNWKEEKKVRWGRFNFLKTRKFVDMLCFKDLLWLLSFLSSDECRVVENGEWKSVSKLVVKLLEKQLLDLRLVILSLKIGKVIVQFACTAYIGHDYPEMCKKNSMQSRVLLFKHK